MLESRRQPWGFVVVALGLASVGTLAATISAYRGVRTAAMEAFSGQQALMASLLASRASGELEAHRRWVGAFDVEAIPESEAEPWLQAESTRLRLPDDVKVHVHYATSEPGWSGDTHRHGPGLDEPCGRCADQGMLTYTSHANDNGDHLVLSVPAQVLTGVLGPASGWMVDQNSRIVAHHDGSQVGTTPFDPLPDDLRLVDMLEEMRSGDRGTAQYLWPAPDDTEELRLAAYAPVPGTNDWSVAVSSSEAEALAGVRRSLDTMSTAALGLVLVLGLAFASIAGLAFSVARQRADRERERIEAANVAAHTERLTQLGQLTAGVAHDLRGPLGALRLGIGELEEDEHGDPELLRDMNRAVDLLVDISSDLLQFSRTDDGSRPQADVGATLRSTLRMLGPVSASRCEVPTLDEPCWVSMSGPRLSQVMLNLIGNALAAGDQVRIDCSDLPEGIVRVVVEDDGPGIPASHRDKVFEPFFTTKPPGEGTGLGLPLCRRFLEEAGGTLQLGTSSLGGAALVLTLPAA